MGNLVKFTLVLLMILFLLRPAFSLYQLIVNIENCTNILINYKYNQTPNISNGKAFEYICLYFKTKQICYPISFFNTISISDIGIVKSPYIYLYLKNIPKNLTIKYLNGSIKCFSQINICIKDGVCNPNCPYDIDCNKEYQNAVGLNITHNNEVYIYHDISKYVLITALIIAIIVLILWRFTR